MSLIRLLIGPAMLGVGGCKTGDRTAETKADMDTGATWLTADDAKLGGGWLKRTDDKLSLVRLGPVWKRSDWPHSDEEPFED